MCDPSADLLLLDRFAVHHVGGLAHTYFGLPAFPVIMVCAVIILSYTMVGGMWSVTLTDALQILVAIIGLVVLGYAVSADIVEVIQLRVSRKSWPIHRRSVYRSSRHYIPTRSA